MIGLFSNIFHLSSESLLLLIFVFLLSVLAISRFGKPIRAQTIDKRAQIIYEKAWGQSWPRRHATVKQAEIGRLADDDELYVEGGITDSFDYSCLDGIAQVARALSLPLRVQDILVIRAEYEAILDMLEQDSEKAFVVTGQPGIGKTTFLIYLLLYRLERRLPTAVQVNQDWYHIFDEYGVTKHDARSADPRLQKCWALCDSNGAVTQPCAAIQSDAAVVILTTSPKPERWKELRKQLEGVTYIVGLPTVMEIAAVVKELNLDTSSTLGIVGKWGPSLRTTLEILRASSLKRLTQHKVAVQAAARALASHPSSTYIAESEVGDLPTSGSSNILFLDQRLLPSSGGTIATLVIPTKHLAEILDQHATKITSERCFDLFCMLSSHSLTRSSAGWMHEKSMHTRMMSAGRIELFRGQDTMLMDTSTNLLNGTAGGLKTANSNDAFYWMPSVINFPGIDGVLGDANNNVFTLQASIAGEHRDPDDGIRKAWETMPQDHREGRCWNFVLVCENKAHAELLLPKFSQQINKLKLGRKGVTVRLWACVLPRA